MLQVDRSKTFVADKRERHDHGTTLAKWNETEKGEIDGGGEELE